MDRRDFLKLSLATGTGSLLLSSCSMVALSNNTGGAARSKGKVLITLFRSDEECILRALDWDTLKFEDIILPISRPHSILQNKTKPEEVFLFELYGSCAKVNLKTKEIIKIDHQKQDSMFAGHGVFHKDGKHLFCTEGIGDDDNFFVSIRSAATLEKKAVIIDGLSHLHHIIHMPNSNTIAFGVRQQVNKVREVIFYDYQEKNFRSIEIENHPGHLLPISETEVVGVTTEFGQTFKVDKIRFPVSNKQSSSLNLKNYFARYPVVSSPSPVHYINMDGKNWTFWDSERPELFRSGIGTANLPKSHRFLTGHTDSNAVILWQDYKIQKIFEVEAPYNIIVSQDEQQCMVQGKGKLKIFSLVDLVELDPIPLNGQYVITLGACI